jgi:hypothetical protein
VGQLVAAHPRVAVKAANGVGKSFAAADIALWFLYCHAPSVVLTTAPTWRQVRFVLWTEMARRMQQAKVRLPGRLLQTRLQVHNDWFALGLSTTDAGRFQGFHAENLLVVLDEAGGLDAQAWEAAEAVAVGGNNRVLAVGNPTPSSSRFRDCFRRPGWARLTLSALQHPNVALGRSVIPGAVTRQAVSHRVAQWCTPVDGSVSADVCGMDGGLFAWEGGLYRPGPMFVSRVLGEFAEEDADVLLPASWVDAAMERSGEFCGPVSMAVDVARMGTDQSVLAERAGACIRLQLLPASDLMSLCGAVARRAAEASARRVVVDAVGLGAGVFDRLCEIGRVEVEAFGGAERAVREAEFVNRRAEAYWNLREALRKGEVSLPRDEDLREELCAVRVGVGSSGRVKLETKEEMRRRLGRSPDRADAVAMLFAEEAGWALSLGPERTRRPAAEMRAVQPWA